jgi:hypothetical protein
MHRQPPLNMPITYSIDPCHKQITEVWAGEIWAVDLRSYWQQYLKDPGVMALRRTIVDMREATIRFNGAELDELIHEIVVPALNGRDWKTAIVVREPHHFGVSRQYQVFAERYSRDSIFNSMEAARTWLDRIEAEHLLVA